ncbi:Gfo/Idh/MocA family oxidoreductase, partial [bacterium]
MPPLRIGIVGAGNISGIYLKNLGLFPSTEVVAVADLDVARAREVADSAGIANAMSTDELLAHPDVDLVLNLTIPAVHGQIARRAIEAGKHVYNEKPLAIDWD